jgi:hypothetical protein
MIIDAVWHSKEYDIPVRVVQYLGEKEGEHWFLVESETGRTGLPLSELREARGRNTFFDYLIKKGDENT